MQGRFREEAVGPPKSPFQGFQALGKGHSALTGREKGAWESESLVGRRGSSPGKGTVWSRGSCPGTRLTRQ